MIEIHLIPGIENGRPLSRRAIDAGMRALPLADEGDSLACRPRHFFFFGIFAPDLRAVSNEAATACFWGYPLAFISRMFLEIVPLLFPFSNGIEIRL